MPHSLSTHATKYGEYYQRYVTTNAKNLVRSYPLNTAKPNMQQKMHTKCSYFVMYITMGSKSKVITFRKSKEISKVFNIQAVLLLHGSLTTGFSK